MSNFIQKYLFWLILASIVLGLLFTKLTGGYSFTPAFCALAALVMIYPSLVPLDFDKIKEIGSHKKTIILSLMINFVVAPSLAIVLGWIFLSHEPMLWLGLILLSILPGGGMVTTWAYKSKADMPLTVGIVFANLLMAVVLAPFYLSVAMNKLGALVVPVSEQSCALEPISNGVLSCAFGGASISPLKIAIPIVVIIIIPLIMAYWTQKSLRGKYDDDKFNLIKQRFAVFSNLGLIAVLFLLMGISENKIIFERPDLILKTVIPLVLFYVISLSISYWMYKNKKGPEGKALAWGTYLRYITLALGLGISLIYQNPDYGLVVIVIILAYLIQIPSSFWLAKKFING